MIQNKELQTYLRTRDMGERAQRTKPPRAVLLKKERWLKKRRSETRALVFCSRECFVSCTRSHVITALIMLAA